jgi:FSR family fosmidomycin resistance protein-like MFS transporter
VGIEPAFGILAQSGHKRAVVLMGGVAFALGLVAVAGAMSFLVLLAAFIVIWPASGAFVSLSQATLMDLEPDRRERNMVTWDLAGSVGVVGGPVLVTAAAAAGISWRIPVLVLAALGAALMFGAASARGLHSGGSNGATVLANFREAVRQLRNRNVLRWLVLLQLADLMHEVFGAFLALYFVDVVGFSAVGAGLAVGVWTIAALVGATALIALLARVSGNRYLRTSALAAVAVFASFLLVPVPWAKVVLLASLSFITAGWYSVPNAKLYAELPDRSGIAVSLSSAFGLFGALLPLGVALLAARAGLAAALWICLLAPVALLVLVPRHARD